MKLSHVTILVVLVAITACRDTNSPPDPDAGGSRDAAVSLDATAPDADSGGPSTDAGDDTGTPPDAGGDRALGAACDAGSQCASTFCADGVCCDAACDGTCQGCTAALRGTGTDGTCGPIAMGTDPGAECAGASMCSGLDGLGCQLDQGAACTQDAACVTNHCVDGFCCDTACDGTCMACASASSIGADGTCSIAEPNTDPGDRCAGALACTSSGTCEKPLGALCNSANECDSGNCVDGFCCNTACAGTCVACSAAKRGGGADGMCDYIAVGDPDMECVPTQCDGAGACVP